MITPQSSQLPPRVVGLLMTRGHQLPPLRWTTPVDPSVSSTLEGMSNVSSLLAKKELVDERMGHAVRSLLFLWNGLITEAEQSAAHAPPVEAHYLRGLCARHRGDAENAKSLFQKVGDHPMFKKLGAFVPSRLTGSLDAPLERFRQIVQQVGLMWEPFAFIDLVEQAVRGGFSTESLSHVRTLQGAEFEFLLVHCVNSAIGESTSPSSDHGARKPAQKQTHSSPSKSDGAKPNPSAREVSSHRPLPRSKSTLVVCCPKCNTSRVFPDAIRGQLHECQTCGTSFQIPAKKTVAKRSS
ncbi:MAG: hypothetical protein AABZ47_14125 [Planctomycetota bacterium]